MSPESDQRVALFLFEHNRHCDSRFCSLSDICYFEAVFNIGYIRHPEYQPLAVFLVVDLRRERPELIG
jgi:hypothetical protein